MANPPQSAQTRIEPECRSCQLLLTDALDGLLSPAEQRLFELHLHVCPVCADEYGRVQQGSAWLEMLKSSRPEPRPELLANILAQTSGSLPLLAETVPALALPGPHLQPAPFFFRFGRVLLEPRMVMSAAMTFCSLALTLSLTGVRIDQMHASDLGPSGIRRLFHTAQAGTERYYDNLRVVHVLESRVDDLRENLQMGRPDEQPAPQKAPQTQPAAPETKPEPQKPASAPAGSSQVRPDPATTDAGQPMLASLGNDSAPEGGLR